MITTLWIANPGFVIHKVVFHSQVIHKPPCSAEHPTPPTTPIPPMTRFTATIELITPTRAVVELHDQAGNWFGGQSFDCRAGAKALYEMGYIEACVSARAHGGMVDTYKWG